MDDQKNDKDLDQFLKGMRLKRPSDEKMKGFLKGVNEKIDAGAPQTSAGIPGLVLVFGVVLSLALVGALVWFFVFARPADAPVKVTPVTPEMLTLEDEIKLFDAFGVDVEVQMLPYFKDTTLFEELVLLDELEFELLTSEITPPTF
jgi:hypothetical protein